SNPVRTMLLLVAGLGLVGAALSLREWPWLFVGGIWLFMLMLPAIEAAEQTVIQKVVPFEKQGRVFGLAMTFEAAAAPVTAFLIAPIADLLGVRYMDTSKAQETWGWLLGEGESRGIALISVCMALLTTILALLAMFARTY